jgi:WD40 repeat protein
MRGDSSKHFSHRFQKAPPYLHVCPSISPSESLVPRQYLPLFRNTLSIPIGQASDWPAILQYLDCHANVVSCVAFSAKGRRVVSGSHDRTVRVWDTETGLQITDPFVGHIHRVTSVPFSPDARYIASGSDNRTIRLWNVLKGELVCRLLERHEVLVSTVAPSPDGRLVASGSWDKQFESGIARLAI